MAEKESTSETVLQVNSFIRGYHENQEIWTPEIGDEYELKRVWRYIPAKIQVLVCNIDALN